MLDRHSLAWAARGRRPGQLILVVASLAIPRLLNWKGDLAKLRPTDPARSSGLTQPTSGSRI